MYSELSEDNLSHILATHNMVIVQYGATWCGNCKIIKPKFKRLAESNEGIEFFYVDAEKFPLSRKHANVSNLPTFGAFKGGELVKESQGNKVETIQEVLDALTSN